MPIPFITYWRSMSRNKALAAINLAGLALGMTSCLFIFLYVHDELGYDLHQQHGSRLLRITADFVTPSSTDQTALTPSQLAPVLKERFPEIEETARFQRLNEGIVVRHEGHIYVEQQVYRTENAAFRLFSYTMVEGSAQAVLKGPRQVVLTRAAREKYFGATAALGKTLEIDKQRYEVTGVIEDLPQNSDLQFFMLLSVADSMTQDNWFDLEYYTYALVREEAMSAGVAPALEAKLLPLSREKVDPVLHQYEPSLSIIFHVQPFKGLHFATARLGDTPKGNMQYVYLFSVAAVLILVIACLNYINFAVAQSVARSREVGIRKAIGASLRQLAVHYIGESFAVTSLAMMIAVVMLLLALPAFNVLTGKAFVLAEVTQPAMLIAAAAIIVIVALLAGSYSAFYTAAIRPVYALSGKVTSPAGQAVRKTSLVIQFAVSTGLLIGAAAITRQMHFIQTFDPGFKRDHVLVIDTPPDSVSYHRAQLLGTALKTSSQVIRVSVVGPGAVPGNNAGEAMTFMTGGNNESHLVKFAFIDEAFVPLLGLELKTGRNLDENRPADHSEVVLVNEAYVEMMGWKNPLEQTVPAGENKRRQVVGVLRNFHYKSLHNPVEPYLLMYQQSNRAAHIMISLQGEHTDDVLTLARAQWQQFFPDDPFVYRFLDETLQAQYQKESIVTRVVTAFSIVALAIAFFGLAGLTTLTIYQRKREIGIRKIIGARMPSLVWLFFREYGKLILVAFMMTYPITGYLVHTWLETFSRHVSPGVWLYVATGMGIVMLALATAAAGIIRITRTNPAGLIRD